MSYFHKFCNTLKCFEYEALEKVFIAKVKQNVGSKLVLSVYIFGSRPDTSRSSAYVRIKII